MQPGFFNSPNGTQVLAAVGSTVPVRIIGEYDNGTPRAARILQPGIIAIVSSGATLTYNIEVTGDDLDATGYSAATGNWAPLNGMSGVTATAVNTLGAAVTAIRARVTAYTSGTLTFQFIQLA